MPMLALIRALTTSSDEGLLEAGREPLRDRRRVVGVPADQHDGELVTAESDEQVGVPQRARRAARRAASAAGHRPDGRTSR